MRIPKFLRTVLISVPIGVTFFDVFGYIARVDGISMQPALNPDSTITDYVLLSRWAVRNLAVERGEIISLVSPKDPEQKIIKRIVGLEGDVISTIGYKQPVIKVPSGHCWVEGDHTGNSLDSNSFGAVSLGLVTAKAVSIVWPPSRWQWLQKAVPPQRHPKLLSQSPKPVEQSVT